jgi:hypothetical protein
VYCKAHIYFSKPQTTEQQQNTNSNKMSSKAQQSGNLFVIQLKECLWHEALNVRIISNPVGLNSSIT